VADEEQRRRVLRHRDRCAPGFGAACAAPSRPSRRARARERDARTPAGDPAPRSPARASAARRRRPRSPSPAPCASRRRPCGRASRGDGVARWRARCCIPPMRQPTMRSSSVKERATAARRPACRRRSRSRAAGPRTTRTASACPSRTPFSVSGSSPRRRRRRCAWPFA
jgi:hypothetical protein